MKRIYENLIYNNLKKFNQMAFLIGPRQVGKTTISKHIRSQFKESIYLNFDSLEDRKLIMSGQNFIEKILPTTVLRSEKPLVIFDEIHKHPDWKNYVKGFFDLYKDFFSIIVTGSARLDVYQSGGDSLMGRYFQYHIYPLTVTELTNTEVPIKEFRAPKVTSEEDFSNLYKYGGFPDLYLNHSDQFSNLWHETRFKQLFRDDIRSLANLQEIYSLEMLAILIKEQAGQLLNYSSLAKKVGVTSQTISRWIKILDRFYYCFTLRPWHKNVSRSLVKEPKVYLWDWSVIQDEGAKIENFVALHLLKFVDFFNEQGLGRYGLFYLRNLEKQEVDFLITKDNQPYLMIESKALNKNISKSVLDFSDQLKPKFAFQSVFNMDYIEKDVFQLDKPMVIPLKTLLSQLL
ncbi:MAG: ATP-binding protein [Alphaproteobacteria bacterium]|nr:ATP-binding protein [Alphaproteobacteria bacterium]